MQQPQQTKKTASTQNQGMEEVIRLYHAWLAVLLTRLQKQEVRVGVQEIKDALGQFQCRIGKEDNCYIIEMEETSHSADGSEVGDGEE